MANVALMQALTPPPNSPAPAPAMDIAKQQALIDAMREQANSPIQYDPKGAISPFQGLAKLLEAYNASSGQKKIDKTVSAEKQKINDAVKTGDFSAIMAAMQSSQLPGYQDMAIKGQLDLGLKDAESKRKMEAIQSLIGTSSGGGGGSSDAGRLALAAGAYPELAPYASYVAGQEKQTKEEAAVTPPGFKTAAGVVPSADDAKKMKSLNEAQMNLNRLMDELGAIYDEMGGATPVGVKADLARQKYEQAKIQIKELEQLGAIQAPDVPIIEGMMPNPSSPIEYGKEQIGIKSTKPRIDAFKNELKSRVSTRAKAFGYEPLTLPLTPDQVTPPQAAQPAQPAGADANIAGALQAIQSGAPRDAVKSRLLQNGYTQEQLKAAGL